MPGPRPINPPCRHATDGAPVCARCARNRARVAAWKAANPERARARSRRWKGRRANRRAVRAAWQRYTRSHPREVAALRRLRSAIARGAPADGAERIDLGAVWAAARGRCALCGFDVPAPGAEVADPREVATLDHVAPVSRGGSHTLGNVRLAHFGCNARRGAPDVAEREPGADDCGDLASGDVGALDVPF